MFTLFDASAPSWNLLLFALLEVNYRTLSWIISVVFLGYCCQLDVWSGQVLG